VTDHEGSRWSLKHTVCRREVPVTAANEALKLALALKVKGKIFCECCQRLRPAVEFRLRHA
jgi:hypothetical protein